jgi:hypothetical protein
MRYRTLSAAFLCWFLLAGCPLESEHALVDSRNAPMEERLLGEWTLREPGMGAEGKLSIYRFNENEYYMESAGDGSEKTERYRGFLAPMDNVLILNVREIKGEPSGNDFCYFKVSLSADNVLTLRMVEDGLLEGKSISSRDDLVSFLRANMENPRLFGDALELKRKTR